MGNHQTNASILEYKRRLHFLQPREREPRTALPHSATLRVQHAICCPVCTTNKPRAHSPIPTRCSAVSNLCDRCSPYHIHPSLPSVRCHRPCPQTVTSGSSWWHVCKRIVWSARRICKHIHTAATYLLVWHVCQNHRLRSRREQRGNGRKLRHESINRNIFQTYQRVRSICNSWKHSVYGCTSRQCCLQNNSENRHVHRWVLNLEMSPNARKDAGAMQNRIYPGP